MKMAVVMRTVDRTQGFQDHIKPGERRNYLYETLKNLDRGGVFRSEHLDSFHLVDSGSRNPEYLALVERTYPSIFVHRTVTPRTPNENAGAALQIAGNAGTPWILFCEDDIDVISNFLESVVAWLNKNAHRSYRLYTFGSNNSVGQGEWNRVTIEAFYGTTCYAMRREDALSMAEFISYRPLYDGGRFYGKDGVAVAHDLHYHVWSRQTYPELDYFLASVPSFVQHIGLESGISNRKHHIEYPSWPGRKWTYRG